MGMVLSLVQFSQEKLQEYLETPKLFEKDLQSLEDSKNDRPCYLDKAWEAVHYILTGKRIGGYLLTGEKRTDNHDPLSLAVYSEQFFDHQQELGLGPASYLTPNQVRQVNSLLFSIDALIVKERYNPTDMTELGVYPDFWSEDPELLKYVIDSFCKLQKFYGDAASKGHAIASYLS